MATYVMSDIHGEYEKYLLMLEKIQLKSDDTLFKDGFCFGVILGSNRMRTLNRKTSSTRRD